MILSNLQALVFQTLQTAICNSNHSPSQCLTYALLLCEDRLAGAGHSLDLEFVAQSVGLSTEQAVVALTQLGAQDFIFYENGLIVITDRLSLEGVCCECYRLVKREFDRLLPGLT